MRFPHSPTVPSCSNMPHNIVYRYPKISDAEKLMEFMNALSSEETYIRMQGRQLTLKEEQEYLADFIKNIEENKAVKLFAFIGDELVGVADVKLDFGAMAHVGVFGIVLKKEYRNQGIGSALLKKTLLEAKQKLKKLEIVTLGVFSDNERGIHLYKKVGFTQYGSLPNGVIRKGKYSDHIDMYLNMSDLD